MTSVWVPGGTWQVQSLSVSQATDARQAVLAVARLRDAWAHADPHHGLVRARLRRLTGRLDALRRLLAQPAPYSFAVRRAPAG
jgi:hypothetical protein